jgi:hypothetical protein
MLKNPPPISLLSKEITETRLKLSNAKLVPREKNAKHVNKKVPSSQSKP